MVLEDKYQYELVKLDTERGEIVCRYYSPRKHHPASVAVVYVTGVGGSWGTPAIRLYPRLCGSLVRIGIDGLRVRYRHPTDLLESVFDMLAGVAFLQEEHRTKAVGLVGHSFGGAVVIQAAVAASDIVFTIVILKTILTPTQLHGLNLWWFSLIFARIFDSSIPYSSDKDIDTLILR